MPAAKTASNNRQVIVYDDFSGGEFGSLGDWNAPAHSFTGSNVVRYLDGSVGPRCGLKDLAPTSVPTGALQGMGVSPSGTTLWFIKGNTVYYFDASTTGSAVAAYTTTLAGTPTKMVAYADDASNVSYITVYGDKCYKLDHSAHTVTAMADGPGGKAIAIYGDRLMVANSSGQARRLYYSEAGVYTNFTNLAVDSPPGYIDVGGAWEIDALYPQRQNLSIAKQGGDWYVLAGVPGVNDVLRQVTKGSGAPRNPTFGALSNDGLVWYVPGYKDVPAVFNGSGVREIEHLSWAGGNYAETNLPPTFATVTGKWAGDVAFFSGSTSTGADNRMVQFREKIWSYHTFDVNTAGFAATGFTGNNTFYYVSDGGSAGVAAKFYALKANSNRPPLTTETLESIGDASTTPFSASVTLPEWWAKDGDEIKVRAVVVDFRKYNHGASADNALTVSVTPRRLYEAGDGSAETQTWTEATSSASSSGTRDRFTGTFVSVFGNGFQLSLTGLVGVAIQKVWVYIDAMPARGF